MKISQRPKFLHRFASNLQGLSRCRPGRTCPTARFRLNSVRQPARRPLPDFRYLELHVKTPESCQDFEECKNLANLCSGSEVFRDSHLSSNSWVCKGVDCKIRLSHVRTLKLNWFQVFKQDRRYSDPKARNGLKDYRSIIFFQKIKKTVEKFPFRRKISVKKISVEKIRDKRAEKKFWAFFFDLLTMPGKLYEL